MSLSKRAAVLVLAVVLSVGWCLPAAAIQLWTKCHVTCRCIQDGSVANFSFVIPVDKSPDIGYEADLACKSYGHRTCSDCCNGIKFSYTYQVTSP